MSVRRVAAQYLTVACKANFPDGKACLQTRYEHVHQSIPCPNGADERHHAFAPPKTVSVVIDGYRRRVKVPVGEPCR